MRKLWGKLKHCWNRMRIWFFMRGIRRDLEKIDRKMIKANKVDKS